MKKLTTPFSSLLIFIIGLFLAAGCFFDPDPGPDAKAPGMETDGDGDADTDTDADGECPALVYGSAADPDNFVVTAVGLPDAVGDAVIQVDAWSDSSSAPVTADVGENRDFALRVEAKTGDYLFFYMDDAPISRYFIVEDADDTLDPDDVFHNINISQKDVDTVLISGDSELLEEGFLVVGGNISQSATGASPVTCQSVCSFALSMPGETGDEIDLFLALDGDCYGLTPTYSLVVQ